MQADNGYLCYVNVLFALQPYFGLNLSRKAGRLFVWQGQASVMATPHSTMSIVKTQSGGRVPRAYQGNEVGGLSGLGGLINDDHLVPVRLQPLIVARSSARRADHLRSVTPQLLHAATWAASSPWGLSPAASQHQHKRHQALSQLQHDQGVAGHVSGISALCMPEYCMADGSCGSSALHIADVSGEHRPIAIPEWSRCTIASATELCIHAHLAAQQHLLTGELHQVVGGLPQAAPLLLELEQRVALLLGQALIALRRMAAPRAVLLEQRLRLLPQPLRLRRHRSLSTLSHRRAINVLTHLRCFLYSCSACSHSR